MSERRLRELERRAYETRDPHDAVDYAAALIRAGSSPAARAILQPLTKKCPAARPLFVSLLPTGTSCAFCVQCGDTLPLDGEGYPTKVRGGRAARKSRCSACWPENPSYGRETPREGYCGRCGIFLRDPCHRCDGNLPDWITGGSGRVRRDPNTHWSTWRNLA